MTKKYICRETNSQPISRATVLFKCNECPRVFFSEKLVKNHVQTHQTTKNPSAENPKSVQDQSTPAIGQVNLEERQMYRCNLCGKEYSTKYKFIIHEKTHTLKYKCDKCHEVFQYNHLLHLHEGIKHGSKRYECKICNKSFEDLTYFYLHNKGHNPKYALKDKEKKPLNNSLICELCGKMLRGKDSLRKHMVWHSGESNFECTACGKKFKSTNSLTVHHRIHLDEKPYQCKQCDKTFRQITSLRIHERYHSGHRPYVCHICHKAFVSKSALSSHSKTHGVSL